MYPMARLTWEDELRLSDALYEARQVQERLGDGEPTTAHDRLVLDAGQAAADELVVAHAGLSKRIASEVLFGAEQSSALDFDDLVQIGMIAMYSCTKWYDARSRRDGIDRDTGNRFSVYSRLYIKREMYRALKRGDAPLTGSIATADRTREWLRHRDRLEEQLGRTPLPREVSESCSIPLEAIDLTLVGRRPVLGVAASGSFDDDDAPVLDAGIDDQTSDVDDAIMAERYALALDIVLRRILTEDEAEAFILWLGIDALTPRSVPEVAKAMGIKVAVANETIAYAVARMRHPQNAREVRNAAVAALRAIDEDADQPALAA